MALQHFTKCVAPHKFKKRSWAWMVLQASLVAGPMTAFAIAAGHPWCVVIALEVGLMVFMMCYCQNWLFERLICLWNDDKDAIGLVMKVEPPRGISFSLDTFDLDNDYSFNLLLQCTEFGVQESDPALADSPYGELIKNQSVITALGSEVPQYVHGGWVIPGDPPSATLHCEFEGSGVHDMHQFAQAMLGIGAAAFAVCLIVPHWATWIVLAIFSLLILLGFLVSKVAHPGSPSDVNPNLPTIHKDKDVLYVQGTWVFDPLHDGYNEIHPIKRCTKIGCWNGDWTNTNCDPNGEATGYDRACTGTPEPPILLRLRKGFQEAQAEETLANQARPEHQWRFHPLIDACAPDVIL